MNYEQSAPTVTYSTLQAKGQGSKGAPLDF
jgi:hypothetical protein